MNRMLVVVFDNETQAELGTRALRALDGDGSISLFALDMISKADNGKVNVNQAKGRFGVGTGVGLAVGALIGLLGGPMGVVVGALAGSVAGAVRDYWVAGVGLDFVEQAQKHLKPGKTALVAEVEEDWVIPVDAAMETAGGIVFRRARADVAALQLDHDIAVLKSEIAELESESRHASAEVRDKLQAKLATAKASLGEALQRAKHELAQLQREADAKLASLDRQLAKAQGDLKLRIEARVERVRTSCDVRSAKLKAAWDLTREALGA